MIQIQLYLKELSNFLRTLTVKNTFLADQMFDTWVRDEYKSILPQELHPYYRNIAGDYILFDFTTLERAYGIYKERLTADEYRERYDSVIKPLVEEYGLKTTSWINGQEIPNKRIYTRCNELPIISSFDTQEKIPFTKELLTNGSHINTAETYKIPQAEYFRLLEKYPTSSDIIKSIVYPIEPVVNGDRTISAFERAVQAGNLELLAYDDSMLEEQERQSIHDCVVQTLAMIEDRWAVKEFCFENMYASTMQYTIWQILWWAVFVQRISNIRTGSVHTYHLWSYLKSNGVGEYRDILTIRQQLFLYRNLRYLIEHKGTQHALEILIYVLLTTQNISLQGKNTKQMLLSEGGDATTDTAVRYPGIQSITVAKSLLDHIVGMYRENPDTRFQTVLEYLGQHAGDVNDNDQIEYETGYGQTTEEIYDKEQAAGLEYTSEWLFEKSKKETDAKLSASAISHRNTKLLELVNGASSNLYYILYTKFFSETLMYRLSLDDLRYSVSFKLPGTTLQVVFPAKDLVGLMFYVIGKISSIPTGDVLAHDDEKETNTGLPTDVIENSKRVFQSWILLDKPPRYYQVEWPYRTIYNGVHQDFPVLQDTFFWNQHELLTYNHLNYITTQYQVYINGDAVHFTVSDLTSDVKERRWVSDDGTRQILFYPSKNRWVMTDPYENVFYWSEAMTTFTPNIETLSWSSQSSPDDTIVVDTDKREYVLDILMKNYHGAFHHVKDFAVKAHAQAMDFLEMYLEDNRSADACQHALFSTIRDERYMQGIVEVNFFNGRTFTEYLHSDDDNVAALKNVMDSYETDPNRVVAYSQLLETMVEALMPIEDALILSTSSLIKDKYRKIVKLFTSMLPYNLAFITSEYSDVNSTVFRPLKQGSVVTLIDHTKSENVVYDEVLGSIYYDVNNLTYTTQTKALVFKRILDDDEKDLHAKIIILDYLGKILEILEKKGKPSSKRRALRFFFTESGFTDDQIAQILNYLVGNPLAVETMRLVQQKIDHESTISTHKEIWHEPLPVQDSHILIGRNSTTDELLDFDTIEYQPLKG